MAKNIGKRLIADVFDLAFFQDGKVAIVAEDLQTANIDVKVTEKDVKGGKGNAKIATLHSGRDISVKAENPVFDYGVLATNLGQDVVTGNHIGFTQRAKGSVRVDVASGTKFMMLNRLPLPTEVLTVYHKGVELILTTDYAISGKTITFLKAGILEGDAIQVDPYKYKTNATAKKISIDANTYAKSGVLVLTTYEIDTETKKENQIQFVFPNAILTGNFTINTKSEVEASNQALEFSINKPDGSDEVGYIVEDEYLPEVDSKDVLVLPISDLVGASTVATKADLTFSALTGATSVDLLYKLSTDTAFSSVATSGSTGVRMTSAITNTATSAQVLGLTSSSVYNFKISYVVDGVTYVSNIVNVTVA